jgi:hypothetical protein
LTFETSQTVPGLRTAELFSAVPSGLLFTQASGQDDWVGQYPTGVESDDQPERGLRALVVDDTEDIAMFFAFLL